MKHSLGISIVTMMLAAVVAHDSVARGQAARSDATIQSPGRLVYIDLTDLSGYQHGRGEVTVKFPLYAGKSWKETILGRHSWDIVVKVLRVSTIMSDGTADLQAHFQIFSPPWGYGNDSLEAIGTCVYSSVKKTVISCA